MKQVLVQVEWDDPKRSRSLSLRQLPFVRGHRADRITLFRRLTQEEYRCLAPCLQEGVWKFQDEAAWRPAGTFQESMNG